MCLVFDSKKGDANALNFSGFEHSSTQAKVIGKKEYSSLGDWGVSLHGIFKRYIRCSVFTSHNLNNNFQRFFTRNGLTLFCSNDLRNFKRIVKRNHRRASVDRWEHIDYTSTTHPWNNYSQSKQLIRERYDKWETRRKNGKYITKERPLRIERAHRVATWHTLSFSAPLSLFPPVVSLS